MTEENFGKMQANLRAMFAQSGIASREDGYALANQAFAEGRLNDIDQIATHQGLDLAFNDNGYQSAQMLMAGRWKGVEVAHDIEQNAPFIDMNRKPGTQETMNKPFFFPDGSTPGSPTNLANIATAAAQSSNVEPVEHIGSFKPGTYWGNEGRGNFWNEYVKPFEYQGELPPGLVNQTPEETKNSTRDLTREQIKQLNIKLYGQANGN
jgi:hypothetical protein